MYFVKLLFCFQILRSVPGTISNPFSWGKFEDFFLHFYPSNPIVVELFLSNMMGGGIPFDFNETMFFEFPLLGLKNTVKDILVSHTSILMYFIFNSLIFVCISKLIFMVSSSAFCGLVPILSWRRWLYKRFEGFTFVNKKFINLVNISMLATMSVFR